MSFAALAERLTRRAAARAESHLRARRGQTSWHRADLLWPIFTKGGR
ncbi:hypothetical protein [Qipengyuania qiaonensis]|uniref:Uncharacterized protein n=1 Tax=Qipengyuania qiaonensis TaxID=2867240 RepID=A0ABS7J5B0_9SPHN|nr:hypothetical protein [Qipengyuania qiaonensis]MBX7481471.1 hypothetical protein [Qipengyuania qiaonensis]